MGVGSFFQQLTGDQGSWVFFSSLLVEVKAVCVCVGVTEYISEGKRKVNSLSLSRISLSLSLPLKWGDKIGLQSFFPDSVHAHTHIYTVSKLELQQVASA